MILVIFCPCVLSLSTSTIMVGQKISLATMERESNDLADEGKTPMYLSANIDLARIIAVRDALKKIISINEILIYRKGIYS